jgi:hypothetical protein
MAAGPPSFRAGGLFKRHFDIWEVLRWPPRFIYGTDLIRNLIPHELGGRVDLSFVKEGVNCRIEFPLKQA